MPYIGSEFASPNFTRKESQIESPRVNKTLDPDEDGRGVNQTETNAQGKRHSSIITTQRMQATEQKVVNKMGNENVGPFDAVANQQNEMNSAESLQPEPVQPQSNGSGEMLSRPYPGRVTADFGGQAYTNLDRVTSDEALQMIEERSG